VDDLKQKLYVDDLETQQQAIRDAQDTMRAAIDTALDELAPLQQKAHTAHEDFKVLSATSVVFQKRLAMDEQGQSEWYNHRVSDLRAKAYGGCVASVVGGVAGLAICYGTAAGVLESYLADLKKEVQEVQQRMHKMGALFGQLGAQCKVLKDRAIDEYNSMGEVKSKLITERNIIKPKAVTFWKSRVLPLTRQLVALLRKKASGKDDGKKASGKDEVCHGQAREKCHAFYPGRQAHCEACGETCWKTKHSAGPCESDPAFVACHRNCMDKR